MRRHSGRVDVNQAEIVQGLRRVGCSVAVMSDVGEGFPDLVVGFRGRTYLFEVKSARGKVSPSQEAWLGEWQGHAAVVRTLEDCLDELGV